MSRSLKRSKGCANRIAAHYPANIGLSILLGLPSRPAHGTGFFAPLTHEYMKHIRSINAQAEFWMKVGMLAEANPTLSFNDIVKMQLEAAHVRVPDMAAA
jgi:hypothetical protein